MEDTSYKKFIKNDIATFSKDINILRSLVRYQNCHRNVDETVAEHSFYVAILVLKLREYYNFNLETALKTALVHDVMEAKISDVPHNIKLANPKLAAALEEAEANVTKDMLSDEALQLIRDFNHGTTPEGLACQLGDILSVVMYSNAELVSGNKVFNYIAIKAIERCKQVVQALEPYINAPYTSVQIMNKINQIINIY